MQLWHPALSGDIPIRIDSQGEWYHDGSKIARKSLVRLFASILRREEDGDYYLVTPVEKWRIQVELHPLLVTDFDAVEVDGKQALQATLNTEKSMLVSQQYPIFLEPTLGDIAVLRLPHELTALCTRAAWYRLVELGAPRDGVLVLRSGDFELNLPIT